MSRWVQVVLTKSPQAKQVAEAATAGRGRGRGAAAEAVGRRGRGIVVGQAAQRAHCRRAAAQAHPFGRLWRRAGGAGGPGGVVAKERGGTGRGQVQRGGSKGDLRGRGHGRGVGAIVALGVAAGGQGRAAGGRGGRAGADAAGGGAGGCGGRVWELGRLDLHGQGEQRGALLAAAKAKAGRADALGVGRARVGLEGDVAGRAAV